MADDNQAAPIDRLLDEAMEQIEKLRYCERYAGQYHTTMLAVAFAGKEIACRMKEVNY